MHQTTTTSSSSSLHTTRPLHAQAPTPADLHSKHPQPQRVPSMALLGPGKLLEIAHDGHIYRLRQTATGKLILTK